MNNFDNVLKYIMHTPENTNPAIVKSMMEGMNESEVWDTTISGITSGSGDINFKYNGELLGSLSESGTAVLKTEMTICEHDIEVEYTMPQTGIPVGNIVNIVNNTSDNIEILGARSTANSNGVLSTIAINSNSTNNGYIFCMNGETPSSYLITFNCEAMTDKYIITTNSTPWAYDNSEKFYYYEITNDQPINGQTYNIVITNKE